MLSQLPCLTQFRTQVCQNQSSGLSLTPMASFLLLVSWGFSKRGWGEAIMRWRREWVGCSWGWPVKAGQSLGVPCSPTKANAWQSRQEESWNLELNQGWALSCVWVSEAYGISRRPNETDYIPLKPSPIGDMPLGPVRPSWAQSCNPDSLRPRDGSVGIVFCWGLPAF